MIEEEKESIFVDDVQNSVFLMCLGGGNNVWFWFRLEDSGR